MWLRSVGRGLVVFAASSRAHGAVDEAGVAPLAPIASPESQRLGGACLGGNMTHHLWETPAPGLAA